MDLFLNRKSWKDHLLFVVCFLRQNVSMLCGSSKVGNSEAVEALDWDASQWSTSICSTVVMGLFARPFSEKVSWGKEPPKRERVTGWDKAILKRSLDETLSGARGLQKGEQRPKMAEGDEEEEEEGEIPSFTSRLGQANSIEKVT